MHVGVDSLTDEVACAPAPSLRGSESSKFWLTAMLLTLQGLSLALFIWQLRSSDTLSAFVRSNELAAASARWGGVERVAKVGMAGGFGVSLLYFMRGKKYAVLFDALARRTSPLLLLAMLPPA